MMDEPVIALSMETSTASNKSENESPTQAATDKLSHLSTGSRKISLESNESHCNQAANYPGTPSTCYTRSTRHQELFVPPTQEDFVGYF